MKNKNIQALSVAKADLKEKELSCDLVMSSIDKPRKNWAKSIDSILATHGEEPTDSEWLDTVRGKD